MSNKVLLTGVTGFLGSHVCKQLLQKTNFAIRCSVRSQAKADVLKRTFKEDYERIEWVDADLTNQSEIDDAVEGCSKVVHVASPSPGVDTKVKNNDFMIKVA